MIDAADLQNRALAQRFAASFEGLPFTVLRATRDGDNATVEDVILGRATSTRFVVAGRERYAVEGHIGLHDEGVPLDGQLRAVQRVEDLSSRLRLLHTDERVGLLIHPWFGPVDVIPESWSFATDARAMEHWTLRMSFLSTALPPIPSGTGSIARTASDLVLEMANAAGAFALEPAAAQLELLRAPLAIPSAISDEDYVRTATQRLASDGNLATTDDVPTQIQALGTSARAAEAGELSPRGRDGVIEQTYLAANRHESPTLLNLLESWQLYLGGLGVQAFGETRARALKRLQALGQPLDPLARKNRDAILSWSIRETVRL